MSDPFNGKTLFITVDEDRITPNVRIADCNDVVKFYRTNPRANHIELVKEVSRDLTETERALLPVIMVVR